MSFTVPIRLIPRDEAARLSDFELRARILDAYSDVLGFLGDRVRLRDQQGEVGLLFADVEDPNGAAIVQQVFGKAKPGLVERKSGALEVAFGLAPLEVLLAFACTLSSKVLDVYERTCPYEVVAFIFAGGNVILAHVGSEISLDALGDPQWSRPGPVLDVEVPWFVCHPPRYASRRVASSVRL